MSEKKEPEKKEPEKKEPEKKEEGGLQQIWQAVTDLGNKLEALEKSQLKKPEVEIPVPPTPEKKVEEPIIPPILDNQEKPKKRTLLDLIW